MLLKILISKILLWTWYWGHISSKCSSNSEANASELQDSSTYKIRLNWLKGRSHTLLRHWRWVAEFHDGSLNKIDHLYYHSSHHHATNCLSLWAFHGQKYSWKIKVHLEQLKSERSQRYFKLKMKIHLQKSNLKKTK